MFFGKPKRAKAVAQPRTVGEAAKVRTNLTKRYPAMMRDEDWGKPKKVDESSVGKIKRAAKEEKVSLESALTAEEIKQLQGKK